MKKKILPLIAVSACAIACASALVACGGDDEPTKSHTEAQWKAAFNAELDTPYYRWEERYYITDEHGGGYVPLSEFQCDAVNRMYFYATSAPNVTGNYLFKQNSKYYGSVSASEGAYYNLEKLSLEEFTEKENGDVGQYKKLVEDLLKKYRDDYGSFDCRSGGEVSQEGVLIAKYSTYELENSSFTVRGILENKEEGDIVYNVEKVEVSITDDGKFYSFTLSGITGGGINGKMQFYYSPFTYVNGIDLHKDIDALVLPEIVGNTFKLDNIYIDADVPTEELRGYQQWASDVLLENYNKHIECDENGTITGDIVLGDIALSTFTLTERDDSDENVSVSNGTYTLNGHFGIDNNSNTLALTLNHTMKAQDGTTDVVFTYIFHIDINMQQ